MNGKPITRKQALKVAAKIMKDAEKRRKKSR